MPPPIRCYSCHKVIGHLFETYHTHLKEGLTPFQIFQLLQIHRYCCRTKFLEYVDTDQLLLAYPEIPSEYTVAREGD